MRKIYFTMFRIKTQTFLMRSNDFDYCYKISDSYIVTSSECRHQIYLRQEENYCTNNLGRGPICDLLIVVNNNH